MLHENGWLVLVVVLFQRVNAFPIQHVPEFHLLILRAHHEQLPLGNKNHFLDGLVCNLDFPEALYFDLFEPILLFLKNLDQGCVVITTHLASLVTDIVLPRRVKRLDHSHLLLMLKLVDGG